MKALNRIDVQNDPVNWVDPWGLFGAGGPGTDIGGHGDFYGHDRFDFNLEDNDAATSPWPWGNPAGHFQPLAQSEDEVRRAIEECDREGFERAMHRSQDYFSHYSKGYRWDPDNGQWGHMWAGTTPDEDSLAWFDAETWTAPLVKEYECKCDCKCE